MKPENFTVVGVKSFMKELAVTIRILKQLRKQEENQHIQHFAPEAIERAKKESLGSLRFQARHYHIAYSEFRGNVRSQIETKATLKADESLILSLKEAMLAAMPKPIEAVNVPEVASNA